MRKVSTLILLIVVGMITIFLSSSIARGQRKKLENVYRELTKTKQELAIARATAERAERIKEYVEMNQRAMGIPPNSSPDTYTFWFLRKAVAFANDCKMSFDSITPGSLEKGELFTKFPFQIELRGSYHGLGRFIAALETLEQLVEVEEFSISADPVNPRLCRARCLVNMIVFH